MPACHDCSLRNAAQGQLFLEDLEAVASAVHDRLIRLDLAAQRGLLDGRRHDIGGQRQIGRLQVVALGVRERLRRLDLPPIPTPHVQHIGHADLGGLQCEQRLR